MKTLMGMLQIETGAKIVWGCKMMFTKFVDTKKSNNPLLRMYFDSDLDSPIERSVEQVYAYSSYEAIKNYLPENSHISNFAKILGNTLARISAEFNLQMQLNS